MKEKIVLVGAGSASFSRGLISDLIRAGCEGELALVDIDPAALEVAEGLARKMIEAKGAPVKVSASTDRRDVLRGATAVICTIGVGGRRAWEADVFIPRKYGIYQPVGDTIMPGGSSRALRMIPAMVDIAEDVLDLAPSALFFNYGNPMAAVCRGVRKATGANMVGLCHGVFGCGYDLAHWLGVDRERLKYTAVGMNHLTWFTNIRIDGIDAMPQLLELANENLKAFDRDCAQGTANPDAAIPFTWELTRLFKAFPAVVDRHITEFFPQFFRDGGYYGKTLGVDSYSFEGTIAWGDKIFEDMRKDALSPEPLSPDYFESISGEHEQVVDIIQSIRTDVGRIYSANLPNTGQVQNLPREAVLECPAVADGQGLRPIALDPIPTGIAGTLAERLAWVETIVDAALEGSREKFVQALIIDGAVDSVETAYKLADDLLTAQADFLPQFDLGAGKAGEKR